MSSLVILLFPPFLLLDPWAPLLPEPSIDERLVCDFKWLILPTLSVKICYTYSLSWIKSTMHSHRLIYGHMAIVKSKCGLAGAIASSSLVLCVGSFWARTSLSHVSVVKREISPIPLPLVLSLLADRFPSESRFLTVNNIQLHFMIVIYQRCWGWIVKI